MMQVNNVDAVFNDLQLNPQRVVMSAKECATVYTLFFKERKINPVVFQNNLTYRAFIQSAMTGLIDGSNAIGWIKALLTSAYKPSASVKGIIFKLITYGVKQYFKNGKKAPDELYAMVLNSIKMAHRFRFEAIRNGIPL